MTSLSGFFFVWFNNLHALTQKGLLLCTDHVISLKVLLNFS